MLNSTNISCNEHTDTEQNNSMTTQYGTVDVGLNFYLHQNFVNMSGIVYTTFHGCDVGTKIKGDNESHVNVATSLK